MNIFKTTDLGGLPLRLDDFRWIDAGYREAFKGIMSQFDVDQSHAVILSGCARTIVGSNVTISAGVISIAGEICTVPAHSYPVPTVGEVEYWDLFIGADASGMKVFQSTLPYDTYLFRMAKITKSSSLPSGYTTYANTKTTFEYIREKINLEIWNNLSSQTLPSATIPGTYVSKFKKDSGFFVHLSGQYYLEDQNAGAFNELIGTLPVGYRPANEKIFMVSGGFTPAGEAAIMGVKILVNGEVRIINTANQIFAYILELSQIPPFEGV